MSSEKVKRQDFVVKVLTSHLEKDRLSTTYLFTGDQGSGKEDLSLAFAQALNCEENKTFKTCGCVSCRKIAEGNHPDIHWVGEDLKAKTIKIEEVRNLIQASGLKPYEGRYKVFILRRVERLSLDASNALLKTLEEPAAKTIFIMEATSKEHLLDTIKSRSFEIRLRPLDAEEVGDEVHALTREVQGLAWEDVTEAWNTTPKDELKTKLGALMQYFRREYDPIRGEGKEVELTRAVGIVMEAKEALEANANQKLVLSRMAMRLRQVAR